MGYLFLAIAVLAGVSKGYFGKKTSGIVTAYKDAVLVSCLRMAMCVLFGLVLLCLQGDLALLQVDGPTLAISALSGAATSAFVVIWLLSVRKGAYMMVDVFLTLGVLVTLLLSWALLGESITLKSLLGLGLLLLAAIIMCSYNNGIKEKLSPSALLLLAACGASSGLADFSQKLFVNQAPHSTAAVFNFYTYVFSALSLFILYLFIARRARQKGEAAQPIKPVLKKILGYVSVMALFLYLNSFFKTKAAALLPAALLYPFSAGSSLILSSLMASTFFHEKLTPKAILGLCIAFGGLLVMNVL